MPFGLSISAVKLIGLAVLALAVLALFGHDRLMAAQRDAARAEVAAWTSKFNEAKAAADANAAELREVSAERDSFKADATAKAETLTATRKAAYLQIGKLKKEIADATAQDECPVAPSVRAALAGLRGSDAGPADGDGSPGAAAPGPG